MKIKHRASFVAISIWEWKRKNPNVLNPGWAWVKSFTFGDTRTRRKALNSATSLFLLSVGIFPALPPNLSLSYIPDFCIYLHRALQPRLKVWGLPTSAYSLRMDLYPYLLYNRHVPYHYTEKLNGRSVRLVATQEYYFRRLLPRN